MEKEQYTVITTTSSIEAMKLLKQYSIDLFIVDIMIPEMDGYELVEHAQEHYGDLPFLFISALGQEKDRLYGLSFGADDYITKPFSPRELVLRVKNILRRVNARSHQAEETVKVGPLFLDGRKRTAVVAGKPVELTVKEFDLLWLLVNHSSQVFTKSDLIEKIWGYDYDGDANTINVHIHRLREKIQPISEMVYIKTVWGLGYKLVERERNL